MQVVELVTRLGMENLCLEFFFSSTKGIVSEVGSLDVQHSQMNGEF